MGGELRQADAQERQLLIDLLHEAAKLEHCLLAAYLFAAYSLKTLPCEFAEVGNRRENVRRAVQFERVRRWKQALLQVATEEMTHLHYVQCMLRALGERPAFVLPGRDPDGTWTVPNWRLQVGAEETGEAKIPVTPLDLAAISRFVLYESTDALQDSDPLGPAARGVFGRLHRFELDYQLESALRSVVDDEQRTEFRSQLETIYETLPPTAASAAAPAAAIPAAAAEPAMVSPEPFRFQSIADFYLLGILPLYQEAFSRGWVVNNDRDLDNELQDPQFALEGWKTDPQYAQEGSLPIGPVYRDKNFAKEYAADIKGPIQRFKNVRDIIQEIVSEGEGATNFLGRAEALLAKVEEPDGARRYLQAVLDDKSSSPGPPTPHWLAEYQQLRLSHLYRFAVILAEYTEEQNLAQQAGVGFEPARAPVDVYADAALARLRDDLPGQLNAAYLVLVSWLSRIYEIRDRRADQSRRHAIEMLVTWPLMSIAIRPLLELMSFFPVDRSLLFRLDATSLPAVPPLLPRELLELYQSDGRSRQVRDRMDHLAVRVLSGVAEWAAAQVATVKQARLPETAKSVILTRLRQAAQLTEVERQFPYRVAGGYSDRMPDLAYQYAHADSGRFEENPATQPVIFDGFVLRFRFAGWGRVQLATDPDPPMDEAGCTGTHMLHAADRDLIFDRALVWQPTQPGTFTREPEGKLPDLGVKGVDASLLIASAPATAGYVPLSLPQPTSAVDPSGGPVPYDCKITGLNPVMSPGDAAALRFDLLAKDGMRPFLNGMNHIISQDGEPIDPFIFSVAAVPSGAADVNQQMLFKREVYNAGLTMLEMHPLQRLESSRQPCGSDRVSNIPDWALAALTSEERDVMADRAFPDSYLRRRRQDLTCSLEAALRGGTDTQAKVDQIVSYAERLALLGDPRPQTASWLTYLLHYGHTLSGDLTVGTGINPVLGEIAKTCHLPLQPARVDDRTKPNARWLVMYTKGVMDTDALSDFVYGELYVPLKVSAPDQPLQFRYRWSLPLPKTAITSAKEYACEFRAPFWRKYPVTGDQERSYEWPDGTGNRVITETLESDGDNGYNYKVEGFPAHDYECEFSVSTDTDDNVQLEWTFKFSCADPGDVTRVVAAAAADAALMLAALKTRFSPR